MRIKFVADIHIKPLDPNLEMRTIELEYEKELEEQRSLDDIADNAIDILKKHWNYEQKKFFLKKISIID